MGKLQAFAIRLDNPMAVYFAGQVLSGHVYVWLTECMETRGIHIKICGHGEVHWTESERRNNETITHTYWASEDYFMVNINLLGNITGSARQTLQPGEYNLPFSVVLPVGLPSSFEGRWGHVRYYCHANIDLPWKFDPKCKLPITVNALCDLNFQPNVATPLLQQGYKTLCCWCCKSGPISAVVRLERSGYVPGEAILISAEITNHSTTAIDRTRAVLRACTSFHARTKSRHEEKKLVELHQGAVQAGHSDVWNNVAMLIPPVPPSRLGNCRIIDVQYILEFEVVLSGPHMNLSMQMPISIGTVPLRNYFSHYNQRPQAHQAPAAYNQPVQPTPSAPPIPDYPDLPPPSYMQTTFAEENNHENDEHGQKLDQPFKPVYACYNPKVLPGGY